MKTIIATYLKGLELGDAKAILALFAEDGIVQAPLYGRMKATQFYMSGVLITPLL